MLLWKYMLSKQYSARAVPLQKSVAFPAYSKWRKTVNQWFCLLSEEDKKEQTTKPSEKSVTDKTSFP